MEQKTFEEIKEELLLRAKKAGACQIGYAMALTPIRELKSC